MSQCWKAIIFSFRLVKDFQEFRQEADVILVGRPHVS